MRRLIRVLLANKIERIVECSDGAEALTAYANCKPDMVLLDINITPGDSIALTRRINELFSDARITILADYDDPDVRSAAHRAGASGYLTKDDLSALPGLLARAPSK